MCAVPSTRDPVSFPTTAIPVVAAPMAGGPSTPALVAAVGDAGGLGFLAAGGRDAGALREQIRAVRRRTDAPLGVNVLVPAPPADEGARRADATAAAAYADLLAPAARRAGVALPEPAWDDTDDWDAKLDVLTGADPVDVVSFTFGRPDPEVVESLHALGTSVAVTVTDRAEALASVEAGADTLVVQGFEAGGHRGTHRVVDTPNELDHIALLSLLSDLPVSLVAAGGVTTSGDTRRALDLGAAAVQAGTAFLLAEEADTPAAVRMGLTDPSLGSTITRAFTGRPARGLRNRFVEDYDPYAPAVYPVVDQLTAPMRAAARRRGDLGGLPLYAGAGWRAAAEMGAADVVRLLAPSAEQAA